MCLRVSDRTHTMAGLYTHFALSIELSLYLCIAPSDYDLNLFIASLLQYSLYVLVLL